MPIPLHQHVRFIHGEHMLMHIRLIRPVFLGENCSILIISSFAFDRNGECCLVQLLEDRRWYRASTQNKATDDTYSMLYIDYGNMEEVPSDRIREMRQEFKFPCVTNMCFIDGKPNCWRQFTFANFYSSFASWFYSVSFCHRFGWHFAQCTGYKSTESIDQTILQDVIRRCTIHWRGNNLQIETNHGNFEGGKFDLKAKELYLNQPIWKSRDWGEQNSIWK